MLLQVTLIGLPLATEVINLAEQLSNNDYKNPVAIVNQCAEVLNAFNTNNTLMKDQEGEEGREKKINLLIAYFLSTIINIL